MDYYDTLSREREENRSDILLMLMPFWTPLIPPLGIACLKAYMKDEKYNIKTIDANVEDEFRDIRAKYFMVLRECIPENRRGNFENIGQEVFDNHMMAYINYDNEDEYVELIKILVQKTFFHEVIKQQILELNDILTIFYDRLEKYVLKLVEKEKPYLVGFSVFCGVLAPSLFAARIIKEHSPETVIFMGGGIFATQLLPGSPNFEYFIEKTEGYIDKLLIGEGEILFRKLLSGELPENKRVYTLGDIKNETFDISTANIPDFSDYKLEYYPHLASYTSRSCPFQCSFCSETIQWGKYRKKKAVQIVDELEKIYERHRSQLVLMGDSLLNPIASSLAKELMNRELPIYWDGYLRADRDVCDIDNTLLWRQGGFYRARLGIESGSERVLEMMGKRITLQQIKQAIYNLASVGIKTTTYWVIGHPGETEEDFRQTLDLIEELKDFIWEAECNPFVYYYSGQVGSNDWADNRKLLYPEKARDMLMLQTWYVDSIPSREETYLRINRFVKHLKKLGIPTTYSLKDIYMADDRWSKLQKNAVPSLIEFKNNDSIIIDSRKVQKLHVAEEEVDADINFGF
ncbi:B12-binding domain-containing radical SAM protein [Wukongibacter sp. M2B1]|uniref:B12-binding domain-containing radical SAM protein n=1 Tax=Wukongibacter sp. M2B1 TaxID=3088895 RepID=UPI003D792273